MCQGGRLYNGNGAGEVLYGEKFARRKTSLSNHTGQVVLRHGQTRAAQYQGSQFSRTGEHALAGWRRTSVLARLSRMDVVTKVERLDSQSGQTRAKIVIAD